MAKDQGPNQTDTKGDGGKSGADKVPPGKATGQHTGGLLNQQDEPQTAEDAKRRAAENAKKGG